MTSVSPVLPPAVELRGIDKRFGNVHANKAIDLVVAALGLA